MSGHPYYPPPPGRSMALRWSSALTALVVLVSAAGARASTASGSIGLASPSADTTPFQVTPTGRVADLARLAGDLDPADAQSGAERILQGDLSSAKAVAQLFEGSSARDDAADGDQFDPLQGVTGVRPAAPRIAGVTGADLTETIFALQSDSIAARDDDATPAGESLFAPTLSAGRGPRKAKQMFWEDPAAGDFSYGDDPRMAGALDADLRGVGSADVFIPLPAAAWSALTVFAGVGARAGFRRLKQRLRR